MRWFRFYSEVLHDPKVQRLPIALRWHWVEILCLANQGKPRGRLPPTADLAFGLHTSQKKVVLVVVELCERGLLDEKDGHLVPHNWDERQPQSDNITDRVKRWRQRSNVERTCNGADTEAERDTEAEAEPHPAPVKRTVIREKNRGT